MKELKFWGASIALIKCWISAYLTVALSLNATSKVHEMLCGNITDKFLLHLLFNNIIMSWISESSLYSIKWTAWKYKVCFMNQVHVYCPNFSARFTDSYPTEPTVTTKVRNPSRDTQSYTRFTQLPYNELSEIAVSCVRTERGGTLDKQNCADCWFCCIGEASE